MLDFLLEFALSVSQRKHPSHSHLTKEDTSQSEMSEQPKHGQEASFKQAKPELGHSSTSQSTVNRVIFEFVVNDV